MDGRDSASPTWSALYYLPSGTYDLSTRPLATIPPTTLPVQVGLLGPAGATGPQGIQGPQGIPGSANAEFSGPSPWYDVTFYGARPIHGAYLSTTGTGSGTSLSLGSAIDFQTGDGLVVYQAGVVGPGSTPAAVPTPAAPTCTVNSVVGSAVINYKIVGADEYGALSAASAATTVNTAAAVFGNVQVAIHDITQTGGVVMEIIPDNTTNQLNVSNFIGCNTIFMHSCRRLIYNSIKSIITKQLPHESRCTGVR